MKAKGIVHLSYRKNRYYLLAVAGCWLVYAALTLFAPMHANAYRLTRSDIGFLDLTIMLPLLVIWLLAVNGAVSFKRYADIIRESPDGQGLNTLSIGLLLVVSGFIVQALLGTLPDYAIGNTKLMNQVVLLYNYVPLIVMLLGYGYILAGSLKLRTLSIRRFKIGGLATILFPYCLLAFIFGWYFYSRLPLAVINGIPRFALPGKWPFFTLALPYILIWLAGILSLTMIAEYARTVSGTIYRRALRSLVRGITAVLGFTIVAQLLQLTDATFAKWALGPVLVLIYLIIALYSIGFLFIARGATELTMIEVTL